MEFSFNIRIKIPGWVCRLGVWAVLIYRRIRYRKTFRRIPLTQGKYAIVDVADYERLSKYKWHTARGGRGFYAMRQMPRAGGGQKGIKMHQEILKVPKDFVVDHINHNGLDNRRSNLRPASRAQNAWNRRKQKGNHSSKYKGVNWMKSAGKWVARTQAKGQKIFIGYFDSEESAARAYDEVVKKYHGEFAYLNFPGFHRGGIINK